MLTFLLALFLSNVPAHAYIDTRANPFTVEALVALLEAHPEATELEHLPALLPDSFLINFTLKHGLLRKGPRGHLVEKKISQSSDPQAPRVILFDERSGFNISYNGGTEGQKAGKRLDMLRFDPQAKRFHLEQIDFPLSHGKPAVTTSDCMSCHGPHERPIFAMYPDWPSFYGSDNDELADTKSEVQTRELADYLKFRKGPATSSPRYKPLYSQERTKNLLGVKLFPHFPYRPDVSPVPRDASRAFAFRPSLRLGILLNRLNAEAVFARIFSHARYNELAPLFLSQIMQCPGDSPHPAWIGRAEAVLGEKVKPNGNLLHYRQLLKLFDLKVDDVDIRYSYGHDGYANEDASPKDKVMEVGYIGRYWNSYFDGSATIDELLAYRLYQNLAPKIIGLRGLVRPDGFVRKYAKFTERFRLDENFFREMDKKGVWLPIPYPAQLSSVHHREAFSPEFASQYNNVCRVLAGVLKKP